MAALPSVHSIAGSYLAAYETLYKQVDVTGTGKIGAADAAVFLKKSGLKEPVLHKVWELSDPLGRGYLDKQGLITALKLIALAQIGKEVSLSNITLPAPVPSMSRSSTPTPRTSTPPVGGDNAWAVTPVEKAKYDGIFDGLQPTDNKLTGDKVKPVFINSNVAVQLLSRIWDLSDIDNDGLLDRDEFAVAMHLVYKALQKEPTPYVLPSNLMPPSKRKKPVLPGAVPVLPVTVPVLPGPVPALPGAIPALPGTVSVLPGAVPVLPGAVPVLPTSSLSPSKPSSRSATPLSGEAIRSQSPSTLSHEQSTWVVTSQEKAKHDVTFKKIDLDADGFATGDEVRPILIQSGLAQHFLAQIWSLCDIKTTGKLNSEQFALAMHLVEQALLGHNPPLQLTPEMIPPSSRPKPGGETQKLPELAAAFSSQSVNNLAPGIPGLTAEMMGNKALDDIGKEVDVVAKEKVQLQLAVKEKEEHVKMKAMEVQGLQSEIDKCHAQKRDLDNQKSEAQRKLDELDEQKVKLEGLLAQVQQQCKVTQEAVENLQKQVQTHQQSVKNQEEELGKASVELTSLRQEEMKSEQKIDASKTQLQSVQLSLKQTNDDIVQLQSKINLMREGQRKLKGHIGLYDKAFETHSTTGQLPTVDELDFENLEVSPKADVVFTSRMVNSPITTSNVISSNVFTIDDDPFKDQDPFGGAAVIADDPFKANDPFKADEFPSDPFGGDPFKSSDPFAGETIAAPADPFKGNDPFATIGGGGLSNGQINGKVQSNDLFGSTDLFGGDAFSSGSFSKSSSTDNFGSDPFKVQLEENAPALPPKKSKSATNPKTSSTPSTASPSIGDPFQAFGALSTSSPSANDPFRSASPAKSSSDPFSFNTSVKSEDTNDPFSSSANTSKSGDLFASFNTSKPSDGVSDPFGKTNSLSSSAEKTNDFFAAFSMPSSKTDNQDDPFSKGGDPFGSSAFGSSDFSSKNDAFASKGGSSVKSDSSFDAFVGGGKNGSDPFGSTSDPFGSSSSTTAGHSDGFADFTAFGSPKKQIEVDPVDEVAWALQESIKEEERRKKLAEQEEADLQKAISLSKGDGTSSEA